jgi:hypothetical protein
MSNGTCAAPGRRCCVPTSSRRIAPLASRSRATLRGRARPGRAPAHSDQLSVQSLRDLLRHLATIVKNRIEPRFKSIAPFDMITRPDALQQRALQLLQLSPRLRATQSDKHPATRHKPSEINNFVCG